MSFRTLAVLALAAFLALPATASNWPHWRGPAHSGVASDTGVPVNWGPEENVDWKIPMPGLSGSTPIVWGDQIFVSVVDDGQIELWTLSRDDGSLQWKKPLGRHPSEKTRKGNMSSPSPVSDGEAVWVVTGTGVVAGFGLDGRSMWQRDLQGEFGKFGILHGYSSSPLLHGDSLYVQVLHGFHTDDPSYVMRINKQSGETIWRVERPTDAPREAPDAYTTPALLERPDGFEIVVSGGDYVTGHDPDTGAELWRLGGMNPSQNPMQRIVASPIVVDDMIYVPSRVNPLLALQVEGKNDPALRWSTERGPDVPTPAVDEDTVYILTDKGIVWSLDAETGVVNWGPERIHSAIYSASPVVADGHVYATSEDGTTTVFSAGPEFEVISENDIGEYSLSSLAVSNGQLLLRTADHLYCIGK